MISSGMFNPRASNSAINLSVIELLDTSSAIGGFMEFRTSSGIETSNDDSLGRILLLRLFGEGGSQFILGDSHSSRNVSLQRMRPSHALASLPVRIFAMRPLHFTLVP